MHRGCYRTEPYGAVELTTPCPSHVMCAAIKDSTGLQYCNDVKTDFDPTDPVAGGSKTPPKK